MSSHDSTNAKAAGPPALQLIPMIPEGGAAGPSIRMQWCVSSETITRLAALGALRPYLLVVVTHGQHEMSRQLLPLHQGERFVRFFAPGTNVVHATIVWQKNGANPGGKIFRRDDDGRYRMDVVEPRPSGRFVELSHQINDLRCRVGNAVDDAEVTRLQNALRLLEEQRNELPEHPPGLLQHFSLISRLEEAVIDMEIDPDHFATEKDNLWVTRKLARLFPWDSKPVDPCHVRRRALLTLVSLPGLALLLVGLGLPALIVVEAFNLVAAGVFLLLGARGIDFRPVLTPWRVPPVAIWENTDSSVWFSKKDKTVDPFSFPYASAITPRPFLVQAFNPPLVAFWVGGFFALWYWVNQKAAYIEGASLLAYALLVSIVGVCIPLIAKRRQARRAHCKQVQARTTQQLTQRLERELDAVSCSALAEGRMPRPSFALRFEGVKAAVCQPFAKRSV